MTTTITKRVTSAASGGATSRVSEQPFHGNFLLLEGDESGPLRLEGDAQVSGGDKLLLEGLSDLLEASLNTPRVSGAPTEHSTRRVTL